MIMRSGASALCARTAEPGLTGCDNKPGAVPPHYTLVKSLNYGLIAWESEPSVGVKYAKVHQCAVWVMVQYLQAVLVSTAPRKLVAAGDHVRVEQVAGPVGRHYIRHAAGRK